MSSIQLRLYVAGETPRSHRAIANLRRIVEEALGEGCELQVIDVVEDPEAAERARILTTPTLVKHTPPPARRVTGDLSDPERVLLGLALDPLGRGPLDTEVPS